MTDNWVVTTCDCCGKKFIHKDISNSLGNVLYVDFYHVIYKQTPLKDFCSLSCLNHCLATVIVGIESEVVDSTFDITIKRTRQPYTLMED
jgi:hypothetical protein